MTMILTFVGMVSIDFMTEQREKQLAILNKLSQLEESVGVLYEIYEEIFPEYSQFWSQLVIDERKHADWLRQIQSNAVQSNVRFSETKFNSAAIQTFLNYIRDEMEKAKMRQRSLLNALSIALQLEESLMERKYFAVVEGDCPEVKRVLANLAAETQTHIAKVREALEKYKRTNK